MSKGIPFTDEFKQDAVERVTEERDILKPFRVGALLCAVETVCATVAP